MNPWIMIDLQRTLSLSEVNIVLRTKAYVAESFGGVKVRNVYLLTTVARVVDKNYGDVKVI